MQPFRRPGMFALALAVSAVSAVAVPASATGCEPVGAEPYGCFAALAADNVAGEDYSITVSQTASPVAILAVNGGGIEPGTSEVAGLIAADDHQRYDFAGTRSSRNGQLRIAAINFDEPSAVGLVSGSSRTVAIHGAAGVDALVFVDGPDRELVAEIRTELAQAGFVLAEPTTRFNANHPSNIVNRNSREGGVHVEITNGLRRTFFDGGNLDRFARQRPTAAAYRFATAVRAAISSLEPGVGNGGPSEASCLPEGSDRYGCFAELAAGTTEGVDYSRSRRSGQSDAVVFAPHGGGIEPGSSEVADAVAGMRHGFYDFAGIRSTGNYGLHLTSVNFDEPQALAMLADAETAIGVHGVAEARDIVYVGGLDAALVEAVTAGLGDAGFPVEPAPERFAAQVPSNISNRTATGAGAQVEISTGLRRAFFLSGGLGRADRQHTTQTFDAFVVAMQRALAERLGDETPTEGGPGVVPPPPCEAVGSDLFGCFGELAAANIAGTDYEITVRQGSPDTLVLATAGGGIEPGTSELAAAIAGLESTLYDFSGVRPAGNRSLHLDATRFDEPQALQLLSAAGSALAVRGTSGVAPVVYVGGLDVARADAIGASLAAAGFVVAPSLVSHSASHPHNLVNRTSTGVGVHLELSAGLRAQLFEQGDLSRAGRQRPTPAFDALALAVRTAFVSG